MILCYQQIRTFQAQKSLKPLYAPFSGPTVPFAIVWLVLCENNNKQQQIATWKRRQATTKQKCSVRCENVRFEAKTVRFGSVRSGAGNRTTWLEAHRTYVDIDISTPAVPNDLQQGHHRHGSSQETSSIDMLRERICSPVSICFPASWSCILNFVKADSWVGKSREPWAGNLSSNQTEGGRVRSQEITSLWINAIQVARQDFPNGHYENRRFKRKQHELRYFLHLQGTRIAHGLCS